VICPSHLKLLIKVRLKTSADRMITLTSAQVPRLATMLKIFSSSWARRLFRKLRIRVRRLRARGIKSQEEESCVLRVSVNSTLIWTEELNLLVKVKHSA